MFKSGKLLCVLLIAVFLWTCAVPCAARSDSTDVIIQSGSSQVDIVIAYARSQIGSSKYSSFCQRFVRICFEAAGIEQPVAVASAREACKNWMVSTSRDNIPVGAVLYFDTGVYAHSAIYLGNNRMIHALSRVTEQEISNSFWDLYIGWGWQAGVEPIGAYIDQADVLTGDVYRTTQRIQLYDSIGGTALTTVPEGCAISVRSKTVSDGETWAKVSYYSQDGYIRLKYCDYLYTAGGGTETKSLISDGVVAATVSKLPTKYYYIEGEAIDASGLEIMLLYADGTCFTVDTGYEIINSKAAGVGRETVLIKYRDALMWYHIVVSDTGDDLAAFKLRTDSAKRDDDLGCLVIYEDIKASRLGKLLKNTGNMTVYSADGEQKSNQYLATGDYIVYDGASDSTAITVVRYGDINGDGTISIADTLGKKRYKLGTYDIDERIAKLVDDSLCVTEIIQNKFDKYLPPFTYITQK